MRDGLKTQMAWVLLLPEVGMPVLKAVERISARIEEAGAMERRAAGERAGAVREWEEVQAGLAELWSANDIQSARRRAYATGQGGAGKGDLSALKPPACPETAEQLIRTLATQLMVRAQEEGGLNDGRAAPATVEATVGLLSLADRLSVQYP